MTGNTSQRWGNVQIWLHWTIAALLLIQVPVAFGMLGQSKGATQDVLFNLHKNVGLIIFFLAIARLAWRVAHPIPYLPSDLPAWQATAAHATHWLLYLLLFAMPLTGFLYTALSGYPVPLFMAVDLAKLVPVNKPLGEGFKLRPSQPAMAALSDGGGPCRGGVPPPPGPQRLGAAADDVVDRAAERHRIS